MKVLIFKTFLDISNVNALLAALVLFPEDGGDSVIGNGPDDNAATYRC
jgi:hypothetical protein